MKVTVVGAGHVGENCAMRIAESGLADVVLVDILESMAKGKALDMMQAGPVVGHSREIVGTGDYADCKGSDIAVITAGVPRKPGMSRDDLLEVNADIVTDVVTKLKRVARNCMLIMVSNPLDVTTWLAYNLSGLPKERVMGMAGVLDSTRFRAFIAMELGCSPEEVNAMVLGGHGDSMVPLPRHATVAGVPVTELLGKRAINRIVKRTQVAGGEIVKLLGTGSAYYAPAAAVTQMVGAILRDEKRLLPASVLLRGEYGLRNVFLGVPVILGAGGVEEIVELKLNREEKKALHASAEHVRGTIADYRRLARKKARRKKK
ncbi:MAG: malate dehydrogenase [Armatimonadota bacterium]